MSLSLSGIVESAKLAKQEGIQKTIKRIMNSEHKSPFDYDTAMGGDQKFTGMPICLWRDTICPYGSGNNYRAQRELFIGEKAQVKGGRNIIYTGQPVVICSLGKMAEPDAQTKQEMRKYAAGRA